MPSFSCLARRAAARPLALLVVAAAVVASGAGCAAHARAGSAVGTSAGQQADNRLGQAPSGSPGPVGQLGQSSPSAGSTGSGGHHNTQPDNPDPGSATSPPSPDAPVIVYFRVAQQPRCKGSSGQGPIIPLIVEWQVTGAEAVTLAEDGAGATNYASSGTETYIFGCSGTPGSTLRHTYTLSAQHNAARTTRSLTVSATVN
jgi:hypothetical protein